MGKLEHLIDNLPNYNITPHTLKKGMAFRPSSIAVVESEGFGSNLDPLLMPDEPFRDFSIYWRWKEDDRYGGEVNIQNIARIFHFGWTDKLWFSPPNETSEMKAVDAFTRKLYGFDALELSMDNTRIAAFYVDKQNLDTSQPLNPEIWLFNADGPKYPLSLNFQQYLDRVITTKGFFGWQTFFLDWDKLNFDSPLIRSLFPYAPDTTEMEEFLTIMPKIFPDQDYTEYQNLYDTWKSKAKEKGF